MVETDRRNARTMTALPQPIHVSSYAGSKGEETPRAFHSSPAGRLVVVRVLERWIQEEIQGTRKEYFRVRGSDGETYVLYRDQDLDLWFLEQKGPPEEPRTR